MLFMGSPAFMRLSHGRVIFMPLMRALSWRFCKQLVAWLHKWQMMETITCRKPLSPRYDPGVGFLLVRPCWLR